MLSAQVSQGFPGLPRAVARTRASRSQTKCLTDRLHPDMKFSNCGLICGQRRLLTSAPAKDVPASGSVPAGCGILVFPSWMMPARSQITCATNCATPDHIHFSRLGAFFHTRAAMRWVIRRVGILTPSLTGPGTARRALFILLYFTGFSAKVKSIRSFRLVCRKGRPEAMGPPAGLTGSLHFDTKS